MTRQEYDTIKVHQHFTLRIYRHDAVWCDVFDAQGEMLVSNISTEEVKREFPGIKPYDPRFHNFHPALDFWRFV